MNSQISHKPSAGFSLVEVMVAITVSSFIFLGLFACMKQGLTMVETSRDITRVSQILQSEMERLRSLNWSDLEAMEKEGVWIPSDQFDAEYGDRYSCTFTKTEPKADQYEITLMCSWTDINKVLHKRQYVTRMTKEGINDYYYRSF